RGEPEHRPPRVLAVPDADPAVRQVRHLDAGAVGEAERALHPAQALHAIIDHRTLLPFSRASPARTQLTEYKRTITIRSLEHKSESERSPWYVSSWSSSEPPQADGEARASSRARRARGDLFGCLRTGRPDPGQLAELGDGRGGSGRRASRQPEKRQVEL